jgi:glycosyltransferase involved in cell wall biosynthesis
VRFGIDISPLTPGRTGVGNYVFYLLKNMLSLETGDEFVGLAATLSSLELDGLDERLLVRHLRAPTRLLYALWRAGSFLPLEKFTGDVELFHATNYFVPPARKAKRIVTIHDLTFVVVPQYCSPRIVRPFAAGVIERFAAESDAIIAYSQSTKNDIVSILGIPEPKISVIYMAVDDDFGFSTEEADWLERTYHVVRPYVLFVGMLEPRKNVLSILRAFDAVRDEVPHQLVLVGDRGWMYEEIFQLCDQLGLGDRARFIGFVGHDKLAAFYRYADVLLFPSFYEGFGLPVLEAMQCGCPVITARNSSLPEVGGDAALYVDAADWQMLAEQLNTVLKDESLRDTLARKGREQAARFSWKRSAAQTLDLYREVVESRR